MAHRTAWPLAVALCWLCAGAASAELPAVARPHYEASGREHAAGTAFFMAAPATGEVVAITTAHAFEADDLTAVVIRRVCS